MFLALATRLKETQCVNLGIVLNAEAAGWKRCALSNRLKLRHGFSVRAYSLNLSLTQYKDSAPRTDTIQ